MNPPKLFMMVAVVLGCTLSPCAAVDLRLPIPEVTLTDGRTLKLLKITCFGRATVLARHWDGMEVIRYEQFPANMLEALTPLRGSSLTEPEVFLENETLPSKMRQLVGDLPEHYHLASAKYTSVPAGKIEMHFLIVTEADLPTDEIEQLMKVLKNRPKLTEQFQITELTGLFREKSGGFRAVISLQKHGPKPTTGQKHPD